MHWQSWSFDPPVTESGHFNGKAAAPLQVGPLIHPDLTVPWATLGSVSGLIGGAACDYRKSHQDIFGVGRCHKVH